MASVLVLLENAASFEVSMSPAIITQLELDFVFDNRRRGWGVSHILPEEMRLNKKNSIAFIWPYWAVKCSNFSLSRVFVFGQDVVKLEVNQHRVKVSLNLPKIEQSDACITLVKGTRSCPCICA